MCSNYKIDSQVRKPEQNFFKLFIRQNDNLFILILIIMLRKHVSKKWMFLYTLFRDKYACIINIDI